MKMEFVFTTLLGTAERLGKEVALVGDEIYILGYPAGIFDTRNAKSDMARWDSVKPARYWATHFQSLSRRHGTCPRMSMGFLSTLRFTLGPVEAWL